MKYSDSVVDKTREELKRRREQARLLQAQHTEEIRVKRPDIYEKEMSVRNTFRSFSSVIFSKNGDPMQRLEQVRRKNEEDRAAVCQMLSAAGYPEDYMESNYTCPKCNDTGTKDGEPCECMIKLFKKYSAEELSSQSSIILHSFDEVRLDIYSDANVRKNIQGMAEFLKRYCEGFSKGSSSRSLYLYGNTGTGKTFFSSCVARELMSKGAAVVFGSAFDLFMKIEDEHFGRSEGKTMQLMIDSDLLIIDDLGTELKKPFNETQLFNIINSRMNRDRPTIISSNLTNDELARRYEQRIVSRIRGVYMPMYFSGDDMRLVLSREINKGE